MAGQAEAAHPIPGDDKLGYGDVIGELRAREGEPVRVQVAAGYDLVVRGPLRNFRPWGDEKGVRFDIGVAEVTLKHGKFYRASRVDDGVLVLSNEGGMFLFEWGDEAEKQ
jgi:hypothetical protein